MKTQTAQIDDLFSDYRQRFVRFAYCYIRDEALAEDFTFDSILKYLEKKEELPPTTNVPAYIMTILKNKCLNHLEHLRVRDNFSNHVRQNARWELDTSIASLSSCDPVELFSAEVREIINATLENLPSRTRQIFMLSRYENRPHSEIASLTGLTTKSVEYHITKTLSALKANLKDYIYIFFFF